MALSELDIQISPNENAYLFDHCVKGTIVLPMVCVIDWFYQAIQQKIGNEVFMYQLNDFEVLKGIKLTEFVQPEHFVSRNHASKLELLFKERVSYRANYSPITPLATKNMLNIPQKWSPWPWSAEAIYQNKLLFHGKSFQVIHELIGINQDGCLATIKANQWQGTQQLIDRVLLDGGLQLACLWVRAFLNKASLPMRIASVRYYKSLINPPLVTCIVVGTIKDTVRCQIDMQFYVEDDLIAEFNGLEMLSYLE